MRIFFFFSFCCQLGPWLYPIYSCRQVYNLALSFWKGLVSCLMMWPFLVNLFVTPWSCKLKKYVTLPIKKLKLWSHSRYCHVHLEIHMLSSQKKNEYTCGAHEFVYTRVLCVFVMSFLYWSQLLMATNSCRAFWNFRSHTLEILIISSHFLVLVIM